MYAKNAKSFPGLKKKTCGVTYQEEQQRWAGAGSWGQAGEPPLIAGTGEWSDSCHSRRAWEHGSWNRPERCIAQTLSPVQSDPENHSLCTGIAPPDGGPPGSAPPTTQAGWKATMYSSDILIDKLLLLWISDQTALWPSSFKVHSVSLLFWLMWQSSWVYTNTFV